MEGESLGVHTYADYARFTRSAVVGDPFEVSRGKGERIIERILSVLVKLVEDLKKQVL